MLEIPKEVAELSANALHAALKFLKELNHPLANQVGEALTELEDAMQDAEATEP